MDPLSITTACVSLTATIAKTSLSVTSFVRSVRAARSDLDAVSRELASLKTLLELIAEDAEDVENFPETLRKHITGILANCELVLVEVQRLVDKYSAPGIITGPKWALSGSEDVSKLKLSLEAHKSALEIALEMVTLSVTKQIKADTSEIRDETAAIKQDTADILQEIARLRAQLPDDPATLRPTFQEPDTNLARYLDDLTSYAETVCWSGEDSDTDDEKTAHDGKSTPTSTPPPFQKSKNSQGPAKPSTKESNPPISDDLKPPPAQRADLYEPRSQPSPQSISGAEVISQELRQIPRNAQALRHSAALDNNPDRVSLDAAATYLRTSLKERRDTVKSPQSLDPIIQRKSLPSDSRTSYNFTRVVDSSSQKLREPLEEAQNIQKAATHGVSPHDSEFDDESQETPKAKVPPALTSHIADLESRLKDLRSQRSLLEDRVKNWSPWAATLQVDGQWLTKQMCEEQLTETRRNENDIGWTLHQAKREREKNEPTPVSDAWFRKVMTERENPSESQASDMKPQISDEWTQHLDSQRINHSTEGVRAKASNRVDDKKRTYGSDYRANDEDDKHNVNRKDSSSTQESRSKTVKPNTSSSSLPRSMPSVPPKIPLKLSEEDETSLTMEALELEARATAEQAKDATSVSDMEPKENRSALIQSGQVIMPSNQHTYISSIHGTWDIGLMVRKGFRGYITDGHIKDARYKGGHRMIHIKVYKRNPGTTDRRIAREVAIHSLLWHCNIMGINACVQSESHWYLQIPFEQNSLAAEIDERESPLEGSVARKIAEQIGSALAYCHAHFIVHLNLDVTKVLIVNHDTVKVTGFGQLLAATGDVLDPGPITIEDVQQKYRVNRESSPLLAPELIHWAGQSGRDWRKVDVWSFAIIIWMMQTKHRPTSGDLSKMRSGFTVGSQMPLYKLLFGMLEENPHDRISIEQANRSQWITCSGKYPPVQSFVPQREPLQLPLSLFVTHEFKQLGLSDRLEKYALIPHIISLIESKKYKEAIVEWQQMAYMPSSTPVTTLSKRGLFGFGKREVIHKAAIPVDKNFFSILRKIDEFGDTGLYYLVQEKLSRASRRAEAMSRLQARSQ